VWRMIFFRADPAIAKCCSPYPPISITWDSGLILVSNKIEFIDWSCWGSCESKKSGDWDLVESNLGILMLWYCLLGYHTDCQQQVAKSYSIFSLIIWLPACPAVLLGKTVPLKPSYQALLRSHPVLYLCIQRRNQTHRRHTITMASPRRNPNIIITGTPGVGKTTHAQLLARETGFKHLSINDIAKEQGFYEGRDEELGTWIVDEDKVRYGVVIYRRWNGKGKGFKE